MSKIIRYTLVSFIVVAVLYVGLTWFVYGSPHPCVILARTIDWERRAWSDEEMMEVIRVITVARVEYGGVDPKEIRDVKGVYAIFERFKGRTPDETWERVGRYLETAPFEEVEKFISRDFSWEEYLRENYERISTETPAYCIATFYARLKNTYLYSARKR